MNIYFDTEFTGLVPNTTLISIGCVAETGEKFYAEFTDYNKDLCDDWIKENVLANLLMEGGSIDGKIDDTGNPLFDNTVVGSSIFVKNILTKWLEIVSKGERIQFVSDVCHYDFYLLVNQIFGGAFSLPDFVNPVCYDICQTLWPDYADDEKLSDLMKEAFDYSREDLCKQINGKLPEGYKHNALYDAEVIKMIYEGWNKE